MSDVVPTIVDMSEDRLRCVEAALGTVPRDYLAIWVGDLVEQPNGHSFHRGMHIGWVWGEDEHGSFLEFLSEHRMSDMQAERFRLDGSREPIETPASMRMVSPDPDEDAAQERQFAARNRAAYADLRRRGLLPPFGENVPSQDVNAFLRTGQSADAEE